MKSLVAVISVAIVVILAAACGGDGQPAGTPAPATSPASTATTAPTEGTPAAPSPTATVSAPAAGETTVNALAAGGSHICALTGGGGVKCWGLNDSGQLGDGTTSDSPTPVDVVGLESGVAAIAAGGPQSCAVTTSGGVKCWGDNRSGQLGLGTSGYLRSTPVDVPGLASGVIAVAAGGSHTCVLMAVGGAKCWGRVVFSTRFLGRPFASSTPFDVEGLETSVVAITGGSSHTCALTATGGVNCWGAGYRGELGDGTIGKFTGFADPVDVVGLMSGVAAIAAGGSHSCAVTKTGGVNCWGWNEYGQLGDGTSGQGNVRTSPVQVVGLGSGVAVVAAGNDHTCALTAGGGIKCWGFNLDGQLGVEPIIASYGTVQTRGSSENHHDTPVDATGLESGVIDVAAGNDYTCVITVAGGVQCWGTNSFGQLGNGTFGPGKFSSTPVDVIGLGAPELTPSPTPIPEAPIPEVCDETAPDYTVQTQGSYDISSVPGGGAYDYLGTIITLPTGRTFEFSRYPRPEVIVGLPYDILIRDVQTRDGLRLHQNQLLQDSSPEMRCVWNFIKSNAEPSCDGRRCTRPSDLHTQ